jgi:hypothetical protein
MKRLCSALCLAILSYACSGQTIESAFTGKYNLITRDGQPLPAPRATEISGRPCTHLLLSAVLTIEGGSWSETVRAQFVCEVPGTWSPEPFERSAHGQVVMVANGTSEIELKSRELDDSGTTQTATLEGKQLRMTFRSTGTVGDTVFVYEKLPD